MIISEKERYLTGRALLMVRVRSKTQDRKNEFVGPIARVFERA